MKKAILSKDCLCFSQSRDSCSGSESSSDSDSDDESKGLKKLKNEKAKLETSNKELEEKLADLAKEVCLSHKTCTVFLVNFRK